MRICQVKGPVGWSALSSVRVTWGGIAPGVVVRAKGNLLVTTLLQPTGFLLGEFLDTAGFGSAILNDIPTSTESFWEATNNCRVEIPATSCGMFPLQRNHYLPLDGQISQSHH
ncbi:hypothetical protein ACVIIV_003556 [Bradyrhizobium sp. USDA 4354]